MHIRNTSVVCSMFWAIAISMLSSCASKNPKLYSDNRYKPIPPVDLSYYKSPQLRSGQNPNLTIGLCISGGGSRAQFFGSGVLIQLDEIQKNSNSFLSEVDYISTISGGGFAAGYYLSLRKNGILKSFNSYLDYWKTDNRNDKYENYIYKQANPLSILKLGMYERNAIKPSFPELIDYELLQYGKDNSSIKRLYLSDFLVPLHSKQSVDAPMFVPTGTILNNCERIPFMPHIIDALKIKSSLLPDTVFHLRDENNFINLPLCFAISGSAAFPGVLPMLKLTTDNSDGKVIRVIDGGAIDNLGFSTLFELLGKDTNSPENKKALIIDSRGIGNLEQTQIRSYQKLLPLMNKSLQLTVDINLLDSDRRIKHAAAYHNISESNILNIGIKSLKEKLIALESGHNNKDELDELKQSIRNSKKFDWYSHYIMFAARRGIDIDKKNPNHYKLSILSTDSFDSFSIIDVFLLYELASQVKTKIAIYEEEKELLTLAGRYVAYLNQQKLSDFMDVTLKKTDINK